MQQDERIPGSPGDMHLSESKRPVPANPHQGSKPPVPPPTPPVNPNPGSQGNSPTRNIIIGAIATIFASTIVYYLTQYINNRKTDPAPTFAEIKESTHQAWKRFVTADNLFYKSLRMMSKTHIFPMEREKFIPYVENIKTETYKITDQFIGEIESISKEKNVDKTFQAMLEKRIKRENESKELLHKYTEQLRAFVTSDDPENDLNEKFLDIVNGFRDNSRLIFEIGATEIEDVAKYLTSTYGTSFDPNEVMIFSDYRKGVFHFEPVKEDRDPETVKQERNVDEHMLTGSWRDGENNFTLLKDGFLNVSWKTGKHETGRWKVEDDLLRFDFINSSNAVTATQYYRLYHIRKDTFIMKLTTAPYDKYTAVRLK